MIGLWLWLWLGCGCGCAGLDWALLIFGARGTGIRIAVLFFGICDRDLLCCAELRLLSAADYISGRADQP